jgi:hypothetical protein
MSALEAAVHPKSGGEKPVAHMFFTPSGTS